MKWLVPRSNEVLLDLDSETAIETARSNARWLGETGFKVEDFRIWRSERNWHGIVRLNQALPTLARVAFSGALGSDHRYVIMAVKNWTELHPEPFRLREVR